MIKGMTGFGAADISAGRLKGSVELKSVNHRYLDIGFYLPPGFDAIEAKLKDVIASPIKRGRVNLFVKITQKPEKQVRFNKEAVATYLRQARALKKEFNISGDLTLGQLVQLPGVVETVEEKIVVRKYYPAIERAVRRALQELVVMRRREGRALARDIEDQLKRMLLRVKKIQSKARQLAAERKKKVSPEEYSAYLKSVDINEEIKRLIHHIKETRALLRSGEPAGKRIDFIAQEMQRETNTIGSKLQDKTVSHTVIMIKSKIEKIREQAQNVE